MNRLPTACGPVSRRSHPSPSSRTHCPLHDHYPGVAWTSLPNGFYAHSLSWLMGPWQETDVITVPADGPVSWTAREDAEAAATVLASNGAYDGPTTTNAVATAVATAITACGLLRDLDIEVPQQ